MQSSDCSSGVKGGEVLRNHSVIPHRTHRFAAFAFVLFAPQNVQRILRTFSFEPKVWYVVTGMYLLLRRDCTFIRFDDP